MEERFEVIVQQEVGVINWNFEQLKTAVAEKMKEYEGLVYTEDTTKIAKADLATLRKLKKGISDKRIEIKNKCLEPYGIIEKQAAELTELIDKPIATIDAQLSEYEKNRRAAVKEKVLAYMDKAFEEFPALLKDKLKERTYDPKFENVSCSAKTWKQYIDDAAKKTQRDLLWIDETLAKDNEEEFRDSATEAYFKNLDLKDVMDEITKCRRQKEAIIEKERERIAAEERAKAEAEARAKIEAEKKQVAETLNVDVTDAREGVISEQKEVKPTVVPPTIQINKSEANTQSIGQGARIYSLRIKATDAQIAKIKGYIAYVGAVYREEG